MVFEALSKIANKSPRSVTRVNYEACVIACIVCIWCLKDVALFMDPKKALCKRFLWDDHSFTPLTRVVLKFVPQLAMSVVTMVQALEWSLKIKDTWTQQHAKSMHWSSLHSKLSSPRCHVWKASNCWTSTQNHEDEWSWHVMEEFYISLLHNLGSDRKLLRQQTKLARSRPWAKCDTSSESRQLACGKILTWQAVHVDFDI